MVPQITAEEVYRSIQEKPSGVTLIDVRTVPEYARGKIVGSINVPVEEIAGRIASVVPDKNATLYLYCLSGSRSDAAVRTLQSLGYSRAFSMTHGLLMWRGKKYPLAP